jgi:hypothetical protein
MRSYIFTVCISLLLGGLAACTKLVTVPSPYTQLVASDVFSDQATATAAVTVIYAQMINQSTSGLYISYLTGLSGDELNNYSITPDYLAFYKDELSAQTQTVASNLWNPAYNYIYQANAIIAGIEPASALPEAVAKQLKGEAYFLRGFWLFYLVNLFGDVPVPLTTDYSVNNSLARTSVNQVYQQIVSDLQQAQGALSNHYVDASDTATTSSRTRPTTWAASAMLARTYLYMGDWGNAERAATTVIGNTELFSLLANLNNVFLANSREAIWQIQPVQSGANTPEGGAFILTTPPTNDGFSQTSTLSDSLLHSFEPGDLRFADWVDSVGSFCFPYKYKANLSVMTTVEYEMVLRLVEQYLIRAEARARQGNVSSSGGAVADLNAIRERAGLPDYAGAMDTTSVIAAIRHERHVEMFAEWGDRWLDMKRSGTINTIMGGTQGMSAQKGGSWQSAFALYPIPQTDRNANSNLTQNNGY